MANADEIPRGTGGPDSTPNVMYVVPPHALLSQQASEQINLLEIWHALWLGKWWIIVGTLLCTTIAIAYVLQAQKWYKAEVTLAPADPKSTQAAIDPLANLGGFAAIAGLAGISVGGGGSAEPIAVLESREFVRSFIEEEQLLPVLYADDWNPTGNRWATKDGKAPDIRDAVRLFRESVLQVEEDRKTNLVRLNITWKDPELAARWANLVVQRLNERMRQRALLDAQTNVAYLRNELGRANAITLQQSVGRILEAEMQKLMLARGNIEFAFRVLDPADIPRRADRPKKVRSVAIVLFVSGALNVLFVLFRFAMRRPAQSVPA